MFKLLQDLVFRVWISDRLRTAGKVIHLSGPNPLLALECHYRVHIESNVLLEAIAVFLSLLKCDRTACYLG